MLTGTLALERMAVHFLNVKMMDFIYAVFFCFSFRFLDKDAIRREDERACCMPEGNMQVSLQKEKQFFAVIPADLSCVFSGVANMVEG